MVVRAGGGERQGAGAAEGVGGLAGCQVRAAGGAVGAEGAEEAHNAAGAEGAPRVSRAAGTAGAEGVEGAEGAVGESRFTASLFGFTSPWEHEKCLDLYEGKGLEETKQALKREEYISNVIEFHTMGLTQHAPKFNTATAYLGNAGNAEVIAQRVRQYQRESETCLQCIRKGPEAIRSCSKQLIGACCSNCIADLAITEDNPCIYLASVYAVCDMAHGWGASEGDGEVE